jgi:hypothetical protein
MDKITLQCNNNETGQICTLENTEHLFSPIFSSGDIMINILLLLLVVFEMVKFVRQAISKTPTHREYQGNNSPDGKEFYQI